MEWMDFIPREGGWTILALILATVFGTPALLSKDTVTKKLWGAGKLYEAIHTRKRRSVEREINAIAVRRDYYERETIALAQIIEEQRMEHKRDIDELRQEIELERKTRKKELLDLRDTISTYHSYVEYVTGWAREVSLMAVKHGWKPPLPKLIGFVEWKKGITPESGEE